MDISSMLEVQVKEMLTEPNGKENVTSVIQKPTSTIVTTAAPIPISPEERQFYHVMFGNDIASVRYRRLHCTACDAHIGSAPSQIDNMLEHPVLCTLLCADCREFYGDGIFEQGDDATDMFCRWCANGGNLYCCSYCSNTFCYKCIKRNLSSLVRRKIEADEKWKCFVCNPNDLYCVRAVCWALLHHVQTVTRILKNEKNMTSEEIEEKMNLDESQCCLRRSKRRSKRRFESNSEEEDETYLPKVNGVPPPIKRKQLKQSVSRSKYNGAVKKQLHSYSVPIPIRPRPSSLSCTQSFQQVEMQPLFSREPTMIKCEESTMNQSSDGIIVSSSNIISSNDASLPSRYDSNASSLYHTTIMNHAAASSTYVRPSIINPTTHRIVLPPAPAASSSQIPSSYQSSQSLQSPPNAMVSIHNLTDNRCKSRLLLSRPRKSNVILTPNIIELDSDSDDEPKVVEQRYNLTVGETNNMDISSDKVVPVALVSTENSDNDAREEQSLRERSTSLKIQPASFSKTMLPHSQELDKLLNNIKDRVNNFFVLPDNDNAIKDIELAAYQKIKQFYQNIRGTVIQLAHINDRVVREYNKWKRSRKIEVVSAKPNALILQKNIELPLDMTSINDSDTETDYDGSVCRIMEASDLVKDNNVFKDLLFYEKNMVHRGVGDSTLAFEDKAVQVYDVVLRDYEKCIGYSLLRKADDNQKTNDNVSQSVTVPDENFGKYEEQYIYYLQRIEDHGIDTEDTKGLVDSIETLCKESIEADSLQTSELPYDTDLSACTDRLKNCNQEESAKSEKNRDGLIINNASNVLENEIDKSDKRSTRIINDTNSDNEIQGMDIQTDEKIQETRSQKTHNGVIVRQVISINNDVSSNRNDSNVVDTQTVVPGSEEDCTIIDD